MGPRMERSARGRHARPGAPEFATLRCLMRPRTTVYCAVSLDGFIAREDGSIDWLGATEGTPSGPGGEDYGYGAFIDSVDVLLMGRLTYETVQAFDEWPYPVPVVVLSTSRTDADRPPRLVDKVRFASGEPSTVLASLAAEGARHVYVDGGRLVASSLQAGLVDELILTTIPILIGRGRPLFGPLAGDVPLEHVETRAYPSGFVQSRYRVRR